MRIFSRLNSTSARDLQVNALYWRKFLYGIYNYQISSEKFEPEPESNLAPLDLKSGTLDLEIQGSNPGSGSTSSLEI